MNAVIILLAMSVFLGTEFFAIPTPIAQLTFYRFFVFLAIGLTFIQLLLKNTSLKLHPSLTSTFSVGVYIGWWFWALLSVLWASDTMQWAQSIFLLTLGVSAIVLIYLHIKTIHEWRHLLLGIWFMMTLLLVMGYIEIIFNFYPLANLAKLDKYNTFNSLPLTRIPITIFENQNDFATMLLAYLPLTIILYYQLSRWWLRFTMVILTILTIYLIYRTQSRLVILSMLVFFIIYFLLSFRMDIPLEKVRKALTTFIVIMLASFLLLPSLRHAVTDLIYLGGFYHLSGDEVRLNLWRNGLLFLGQTLGLGVGAGNIETWMENQAIYPVENIVNIHNWWLEIAVGYGLIVFIFYCLMYGLLIHRLLNLRYQMSEWHCRVCHAFIAFLGAFVFASVTSANNMLIEWHWVYFGLILSYIKLAELHVSQDRIEEKRRTYEFINSYS